MSEFERYTPPETKQESTPEKPESAGLKPETIRNIQDGPPGKTEPEVPPHSIEKVESATKGKESVTDKEPGSPFKPSVSDDPGAAQNDNPVPDTQAADDQANDTQAADDTQTADARDDN